MAVSKRLRYEVLRRDNYTCRYCGAKAPDVEITVDHVVPKALGGSDTDPANLVAACRDCNGGKTSSSPDAPLVADVSDSAVQWAAAMRAAAARMLANIEGRQADREQFREWWDAWGVGEGRDREQIPIDPDWESTVDQLLAAGLPLLILKDCINTAMRRKKVANENKFRYMCGVAWRKVGALREIASGIATEGDAGEAATADLYAAGRASLARELLATFDDDDRAELLERAGDNSWYEANGEPPPAQTEEEVLAKAAEYAVDELRDDLFHLRDQIALLIGRLPDGVGEAAMREARTSLYEYWGSGFSKSLFLIHALRHLDDELRYPAAEAQIQALPTAESSAWIAYAIEVHHRDHLSDKGIAVRAAKYARELQDGRHVRGMCSGPGEHIPACIERGTYYARIAGLDCCEREQPETHKGHLVCERHLEVLMDGSYVGKDGKTLTAVDFAEAKEAVPFLWRACDH